MHREKSLDEEVPALVIAEAMGSNRSFEREYGYIL